MGSRALVQYLATTEPLKPKRSLDARFDQLPTLQMSRTNMQNEKVMIITGGSSGIGRAAALRFANQGDQVLITGRRAGPVEQTVAEHKNIAGIVANTASAEDARRTTPRRSTSGAEWMFSSTTPARAPSFRYRMRQPIGSQTSSQSMWSVRACWPAPPFLT